MYEVEVKPLTPIWTGDADRKNTTLRETGIIGSLRWWYEALIRGLGGTACDPTNTECKDDTHCDACELFGCKGWARKFRLEVDEIKSDGMNKPEEIIFEFIPLRKVDDIEWALLNKTLQIIADYGALGGKLAEPNYGLIEIKHNDLSGFSLNKNELERYLKKNGNNIENPNIRRFIFINQNLEYQKVKDLKNELHFLKGNLGKGKRYFYKTLKNKPYRLFLYAENDNEYNQIVQFSNKSVKFVEGKEILEGLK